MKEYYKYIASKHVDKVYEKGIFLFRNLTYYKQYECNYRGDPFEGLHRDNPDNDITIRNLTTGHILQDDLSITNEIAADSIFIFCLSKSIKSELFEEFRADRCIVINDLDELIIRLNKKLKKMMIVDKRHLIYNDVTYYNPNESINVNIKDPSQIPFLKHKKYSDQDEFRLVFGKRKAFTITTKIILNKKHDFKEEAMKESPQEILLRIGNISDIARIIKK
jgi:hypothetical protein